MTYCPTFLDTPHAIREHLEYTVEPCDRSAHGVRFILCDEDNRVRVHCPMDGVPPDHDSATISLVVSVFAEPLAATEESPAMLVVLTRPEPATITDLDKQWFQTIHEVCAKYGIRVLGVHLMTPHEHRVVALDDVV